MRLKWLLAAAAVGMWLAAADRPVDFNQARISNLSGNSVAIQGQMQIVTWNIDRGTQMNLVADELKKEPAQLYLFQEVDWGTTRAGQKDVAQELGQKLRRNMAYAIEFEELSQEQGKPAYIGQATLSVQPIQRARVLRFQRQSGFWKPRSWVPSKMPLMQRRLGSRVALVTEINWDGKLLVVYNAHLESRSMGLIQAAQIDEMLDDLNKNYPPGTDAIVGGDLNSKYFPSVILRKLEKSGFRSALGEKIERTHAIAMALDWIFVRGNFEWVNGRVDRNLHGSDHYPVMATLIRKK